MFQLFGRKTIGGSQRATRRGLRRRRRQAKRYALECLESRCLLAGTGEIHGTIWNDHNGDGLWNDDEPGLADWTTFLDLNDNGQLDEGEPKTVTMADDPSTAEVDETGMYRFVGLDEGSYIVAEVQRPDWEQTFPSRNTATNLIDNGSFESGDFSDWTVATTGDPFEPWGVNGAGVGSMAATAPQDGDFVAWNGFDGEGPMEFTMFQDVVIPERGTYSLNWQDRVQWEFFSATLPRTYEAQIRDVNTNEVLETLFSLSTGDPAANPMGDTGWVTHNADVSSFAGSTVRLYFVAEIPQFFTGPGQIEIDAISLKLDGPRVVDLGPGEIVEGIDFGNKPTRGSIHGSKWHDLDRDGERDAGEPSGTNITIYLDLDEDGELDAEEPSTLTDSEGQYWFTDLVPLTTYTVAEIATGWEQTFPAGDGTHRVAVGVGEIVEGIDFGIFPLPGEIHGTKWYDADADAQRDANEKGLADWTIYLDSNRNGQLDEGEPNTMTMSDDPDTENVDETGMYWFTDLEPLTSYTVAEIPQPDWNVTFPLNDSVVNGSFETGDFTGWTAETTPLVFAPWAVSEKGAGNSGLAATEPQDGDFSAWNNFLSAREFRLYQDLAIPLTEASLTWQDRLQWDFTQGFVATLPRTYEVQLRDPGSGDLLDTLFSFSTGDPATNPTGDTGWVTHTADLSSFAGKTVRLYFRDENPERFTGPGQVELDAVSVPLDQPVSLVDVGPGEIVSGIDFGDRLTPAEIHGTKWQDLNGDGQRDDDEPPVEGWTIYLDLDEDGELDTEEPSILTDANGEYRFINVVPRQTYVVAEEQQVGWAQTFPTGDGAQRVTLDDGDVAEGVDFGNQALPGEIHGTKWNDLDGDGERDANEPGLAGWTIYLDLNDNGQLDEGEPTTVTLADDPNTPDKDEAGSYWFADLAPQRTYVVAAVAQPDWEPTFPSLSTKTDLMVNGSFESGDFTGWTVTGDDRFGVRWRVSDFSPAWFRLGSIIPQDGSFSAANGFQGDVDFIMYQDFDLPAEGSYTLNWQDRVRWDFTTGNEATLAKTHEVQLRDPQSDDVLATLFEFSTGTPANNPTGDTGWMSHSVDISSFVGSTLRVYFVQHIPEAVGERGQMEFDGVNVAVVRPLSVVDLNPGQVVEGINFGDRATAQNSADFNADSHLDCADVDSLVAQIVARTNLASFDLTGDTLVDADDLAAWLASAGSVNLPSGKSFAFGDANLDGKVDSIDLNEMALHWRGNSTAWCDGDFTADGMIDAQDLNAIALHWRQDVSGAVVEGAALPNAPTFRLPRAPLPQFTLTRPTGLPYVTKLDLAWCQLSSTSSITGSDAELAYARTDSLRTIHHASGSRPSRRQENQIAILFSVFGEHNEVTRDDALEFSPKDQVAVQLAEIMLLNRGRGDKA